MKKRYVYDIELFANFFSVVFIDISDKKNKEIFVIHRSSNRNDILDLINFISNSYTFIGYNSSKYDDLILNYLLINKTRLISIMSDSIIDELFNLSQEIINNSRNRIFYKAEPTKSLSNYKHSYKSLDLMSVMAFDKNKIGLKKVSVNMKWHKIQDLPKKFNSYINKDEVSEILEYNENDVLITLELLINIIDEIKLRELICKQYDINVMSSSRSDIADKIMTKLYSEMSGIDYWDFKDLRDNVTEVHFKDIIWDKISFETTSLKELLKSLKNTKVVAEKGNKDFHEKVLVNNCIHTMAKGGLHSKMPPMIVEEDDEYCIIDLDYGSFYPNIMILLNIIPPHLGDPFLDVLKKVTKQRLKAKAEGDKVTADALKIVINSIYGKLGFEFGYMYSPSCMYKTTINGQLILLKTIENLELHGFECFYSNTDGATFKVKKGTEELFYKIANDYANEINIPIEYAEYEKCVIRDVNAYSIKTKEGKVKEKNLFSRKIELDKGYDMPVISEALYQYYVNNIPVEDTMLVLSIM
jgi:DNA polymerase elongation subunit (family B)